MKELFISNFTTDFLNESFSDIKKQNTLICN